MQHIKHASELAICESIRIHKLHNKDETVQLGNPPKLNNSVVARHVFSPRRPVDRLRGHRSWWGAGRRGSLETHSGESGHKNYS